MFLPAGERWFSETGSGERLAYIAAGVAWTLSFISPPASGPVPGLTSGLFAVFAWAVVLLSARRECVGGIFGSKLFWALMIVFFGVFVSAASGARMLDAAIILFSASVFLLGVVSRDLRWLEVFFLSLVVAGVINFLISVLQVIFPLYVDGIYFFATNRATPGRAVGNLGQPNLLATQFNLALVALLALRITSVQIFFALTAVLCAGVALTGSRTGLVLLLVVLFFGATVLPKSVSKRMWFFGGLAGFFLALIVNWLLSLRGGVVFFWAQRAVGGSDFSSSRFLLWLDCLRLLENNPWLGVGWGMLNYVWTMTAAPVRSSALLDHAHNLSLHFALELGLPASVLITGILGWALWIFSSGRRVVLLKKNEFSIFYPHVIISVWLLVLHSQVEYPLWYVFFLLPFSYWLGFLVRSSSGGLGEEGGGYLVCLSNVLQATGVVAVVFCVFIFWDYGKITRVYAPSKVAESVPFGWRVDEARKSVFFGHYGDLAFIFTNDPRAVPVDVFQRPMRNLINPRLLRDYSLSLNGHEMGAEASEAVARLREFRAPIVEDFFSICKDAKKGSDAFQCQ